MQIGATLWKRWNGLAIANKTKLLKTAELGRGNTIAKKKEEEKEKDRA